MSADCLRIRRFAFSTAALLSLIVMARSEEQQPGFLTSRPRSAPKTAKLLPIGEEMRTAVGQRRRVALDDGSVLYVNENTQVKRDAAHRLMLTSGEIVLDATNKPGAEAFRIRTPRRELTMRAGRCDVRAGERGTAIIVASGEVQVAEKQPIRAGQQLSPQTDRPESAPRVSHHLAWTRDLMAEADSPLVPASQYAGGRVIVRDADGQEAQLSLRKYHIDVHIEDGFARTTIDQTYFNHTQARLEGTFYFPLPADASLSRLAMYVDGQRMEGGMVERDRGRRVFEEIVYQQRDPALLEWLDGSTFKMRVFPLEPRQEKRLILSYTQKLPSTYGQWAYRFPTGHSLGDVRQWSFHARVKNGGKVSWHSPSHSLAARNEGEDLLINVQAKNVRLERDVVLTLGDGSATGEETHFRTAEQEGAKYLLLRYRPALASQPRRQRRDWVFLFESSGDRDPLVARTQIEIMRGLLANAESDDTFAVLTANTRVRSWMPQAQPVTPENVQSAIAFLEKAHLIGALDLGQAFSEARPYLRAAKEPYLVHVGSGIAAMGERRNDVLARRIPEGTHYVGIGVGKRWNRALMKAAAERTAGHFTQINPDETLSWRTFELSATLNTPRLLDVRVTDKAGQAMFLPFARSLAQGEEIAAIARIDKAMPQTVVIRGKLDGQPFERELPVENIADKADYLPRSWARLEIERLLAEDAVKHKQRIIELSKAMYVMTPFTSLLVLENEEMYVQYKVDRGRKDHWAMYPCPEKIAVVYEPEDGQPGDPKKGIKPSVQQVYKTIVRRGATQAFNPPVLAKLPYINTLRDGTAPAVNAFNPNVDRLDRRDSELRKMIEARVAPDAVAPLDWASQTAAAPQSGKGSGQVFNFWMGFTNGHSEEDAAKPETDSQQNEPRTKEAREKMILNGLNEVEREEAPEIAVRGFLAAKATALQRLRSDRTFVGSSRNLGFDGDTAGVIGGLGVGASPAPPPRPDIEEQTQELLNQPLLYQRPSYSGEDRLFFDLVTYAPGLNTSAADIRAVIESEAAPHHSSKPGVIEDAVRRLFDRSRPARWRAYVRKVQGSAENVRILYDGQDRYAWERSLPIGMRERVVCDGTTLWHLYPEIGLAARRRVSRFHRLDLARIVPLALPKPEDLARGADLRIVAERTVAIVPHSIAAMKGDKGKLRPYAQLRLVFAPDGRFSERQIVEMPSGKVLSCETYSAESILSAERAPNLKPDTSHLVVLSLPYRTREHVLKTRKIENKDYSQLRFEDGLELLAADFAAGNNEIANVFQRCFAGRDQHQLGLYVLLAASGQNLDSDHLDVLARHPNEPLAQYLALHSSPVLRKHASQWAVGSNPWGGGFLHRLALAHALLQRWKNGRALGGNEAQRQAERERALNYVRANKGSSFAWALLGAMQDAAKAQPKLADAIPTHRALIEAWRLFADVPGLSYAARYEEARSLFRCGQTAEARKRFRDLYEQTRKEDRLPPIDADFRAALLDGGEWGELLRQTAARLIEHKQRPAVLILARQCWLLDDQPLADHLLGLTLNHLPNNKDRLPMRLAALSFLWHTGQLARADDMLRSILTEPNAPRAVLWRWAAKLAEKRNMPARQMECLERALEEEHSQPSTIVNIKQVRQDYASLLNHYQSQALALTSLKIEPPAGFRSKVIRTADRWRALDREGAEASQLAANILRTLGQRESMWDYLTTPVALRPNEAEPWAQLAKTLNEQGEWMLSDRAYRAACEAEPTNAQILWDRAGNLRQAGQLVRARELYRQLADGEWQPRFRWLQTRARWEIENKSNSN